MSRSSGKPVPRSFGTTIAAISTPPGEGAIAVIRITGPDVRAIIGATFSHGSLEPRKATLGRIVDREGRLVDSALATFFPAPHSYTGEDVVEFSCHGGIVIAAHVLQVVMEAGARAAAPGEFTQRAFLNGQLDLTQAEAVMDLIRAQTPRAARAAAEQLEGRIGDEIEKIREGLLEVVAHLEAYIDFPEEDIDPATGEALLNRISQQRAKIERLLETAAEGRILREGIRMAICGRPNAGKSSLLNRLVGFERAIVSPVAGTTRDTIEETISLKGIPFRVIDTAGLRESDDVVESEGVERARRAIAGADIVLRVIDGSTGEGVDDAPAAADEILVANKGDLSRMDIEAAVWVSCLTGTGIDELVDRILNRCGVATWGDRPTTAAVNARHQACLRRAQSALTRAEEAMKAGLDPEFVAVDLREGLDSVGEVIGAVGTEDILGKIFSTFCIGK